MPRRVFFSFHYSRDIRRVAQVRNSWRIRQGNETQPFLDKADWESIKRTGEAAIKKWIEDQLKGTSVTVVLVGSKTYDREWVKYEIRRSYELGKGILVVRVHNVNDPVDGTDAAGKNPLDHFSINKGGVKVPLSSIYKTYDWVLDDGYKNLEKWIDDAAKIAGR